MGYSAGTWRGGEEHKSNKDRESR